MISHHPPLEKAPKEGTLHMSSLPILRALRENDPGSVAWAEHWVTREQFICGCLNLVTPPYARPLTRWKPQVPLRKSSLANLTPSIPKPLGEALPTMILLMGRLWRLYSMNKGSSSSLHAIGKRSLMQVGSRRLVI